MVEDALAAYRTGDAVEKLFVRFALKVLYGQLRVCALLGIQKDWTFSDVPGLVAAYIGDSVIVEITDSSPIDSC